MSKLQVRCTTILLSIVALAILAAVLCYASDSKVSQVPQNVWSSLVMGSDEMPWDVVLWSLDTGSSDPPILKYRSLSEGQAKYEENWKGIPRPQPGTIYHSDCSIRITIAIANSPAEANRVALKESQSYAVSIPETTGDESVKSFADRAWGISGRTFEPCLAARIIFTRGNVICDISMDRADSFDPELLIDLSARLSRKIDAALAGKPGPVPVLPLAADQELRVDLEGAWKMRDLGARLWGHKCTTIALYDINGIPRSLPAKRVGTDDYMVPLRHLAAIVGPNARVKVKGDEAKTTIKGKALVFNKGKSVVQADQRAAQLDRPVEFAEGEVLVPLKSVVRNALGKGISWEQRGTTMIGRIE